MDTAVIPTEDALQTLALVLADTLRERGEMLATAESCTGGWIAKLLTDIPGSSAWFAGAAVTYSNDAKQALLGIAPATLERHGAVSRECALEMAVGALARFGATIAVSVTGVAGPTGGSPDKPVGTVWIAWKYHSDPAYAEVFHFDGDRDAVRRQTVAAALNGIRKILTQ